MGRIMTTTVTVEAHCNEDVQVRISRGGDEAVILKDGEKWQNAVYDDVAVHVCEEPAGQ